MSAGYTRVKDGLRRHIKSKVWFLFAKVNGKLLRESLGTTDWELAKRLRDSKIGKAKKRTGEITFKALAANWLETRKGKQGSTRKNDNWSVGRLKDAPFYNRLVHKIKPTEYASFRAGLGVGAKSNNNFLANLRGILDAGVTDGYLASNPLDELKDQWQDPKKDKSRRKRQIATVEEHAAIVESIRIQKADTHDESADWVEFLGLAGIGEAEAQKLDWSDFDFKKEEIDLRRIKTGVDFYVPFYPWLKPWIQKRWKADGEPRKGKVFKILSAKQAISNACERLKIRKLSPRAFRNMLIWRLRLAGVDPEYIAKYQGHNDRGKTIMETYVLGEMPDQKKLERTILARLMV